MTTGKSRRRLWVVVACLLLGGTVPEATGVTSAGGQENAVSERVLQHVTESLQASRNATVVGAPVSFRFTKSAEVSWSATVQPGNHAAQVVAHPTRPAVVVRPTRPGTLTVTATTPDGTRHVSTVTVDPRSPLLEQYAPILHYDDTEQYLPTRYEAFFHHSSLIGGKSGDTDDRIARRPTVFDLGDTDGPSALDLEGDVDDYPTYDDAYNTTVYASVHRRVTFRRESYTAITYWLFYIYDPKVEPFTQYAAHASDIESVTVLVNASGPQWVGASQHYGGELVEWEKTPHSGTHLHVYPAVGAHSNYLVNTEAYNGSGIFVQVQHVLEGSGPQPGSGSFSPVYYDRTGDDMVLRHAAGQPNRSYELVPQTGTERWASFQGGLEGEPGKGLIPMRQARWIDPAGWMQHLLSDESQVTFVTELLSLNATPTALTGEIEFQNLGPKPRTAWVVLDAKPSTARWSEDSTVTLLSRQARVGTGVVTNVSYDGPYPRAGADTWDLRVRLFGYDPSVSEPEDIYFAYTTTYPADVPPEGVDLAARAPTSNSWHLPVFVSKYLGGAPVVLWLLLVVVIGILGRHLRRRA
jgi:hypothetical protein